MFLRNTFLFVFFIVFSCVFICISNFRSISFAMMKKYIRRRYDFCRAHFYFSSLAAQKS